MKEVMATPELACEVTLQPIHAFGMDAAIIFSDILTIPDAFGLGLDFPENKGPVFQRLIQRKADVDNLDLSLIKEKLHYVAEAIRLAKGELKETPLLGFSGAPFTLASYMVGRNLEEFMKIVFTDLPMIHSLLDKLSYAVADYINLQIKAGADAIQIFDSWSSVLSWSYFQELSLPYLKKTLTLVHNPEKVPITLFGTSYSVFYPLLQDLGIQAISFDSKASLPAIRPLVPSHIALQGNLDPHFLLAPKSILKEQTELLLNGMKGKNGFIFNLGHGVMPAVPEENVKFVVDLVKGSL
jgi:uroporphyrinogen decarboxylase